MDASDPKRLEGPRARSLAMYPWDWHEVRFRDFHVHTTVEKVEKTIYLDIDVWERWRTAARR